MAFSINCNNKGCRKLMEPYLDLNDDKVYCSECDQEIINITYFVKTQMKTLKQFRQKKSKNFSVKCDKCGKEEQPKLIDKEIVCGVCSKSLEKLSPIFKNMLKEYLKNANKDV